MLTSRFTSTLRRARRRDPVERLTVTIAGRSCGVSPIAIASENSSASMNGPMQHEIDREDRHRQDARDPDEQEAELPQPDLERRLGRTLTETRRDPTESGMHPGAHDDPAGRAFTHDRSHERARAIPAHDRVGTSSRPEVDSPVSTASSHSSSVGVEQSNIGRDDVADRKLHQITGHQLGDVDPLGRPVPHDERRMMDLRMQRLDCKLGAVLVDEAETDRDRHDHGDDQGVVGSPVNPETAAAASSSTSNGLRT